MAKKNSPQYQGAHFIQAAWQFVYQQGYDDTTVEEIIEASWAPPGPFIHYFEGRPASVSFLFDESGEELMACNPWSADRFEVLMELNRELFA
ncbi:MAG: TetR family transcriptional regulator [Lawsonibacter sp.]